MAASDAASQRAARGLLQIQQLPQAQVVPTRRMRGAPAAVAGGKGDRGRAAAASAAAADDKPTVPADLTDLLPRTDIGGQVTEELIRRLGSANWKACRCPIQSCQIQSVPRTDSRRPGFAEELGSASWKARSLLCC